MRVLLTDGNFKHTLAAVRSLGKRGIDVTVLSHLPGNLSSLSKYCAKSVKAPNPERGPEFAKFLVDFVKNNHHDVLLPIGFESTMYVDQVRSELEKYVKIPLVDSDMLDLGSNKNKTLKFADSIGIRIPKTWYPSDEAEVAELSTKLSYPIVIKGIYNWGVIHYANNPGELIKWYGILKEHSPVLQEYIPGEGYGFFALYNRGKIRAIFMHKRIREYPATGGPSAVAMSMYDTKLLESGKKLLDALNWHGVAMVEYKKDSRTGEFVLMEINAKFWGSLGLAIASGVDFPYLACQLALLDDIEPVMDYKLGVVYRWLFPSDIFNVITCPRNFGKFLVDFLDSHIQYDIDIFDIKPTIMQIGQTFVEFLLRLKRKTFWNQHGCTNI